MIRQFALSLGAVFIAAVGSIVAPLSAAQAVQLSDGTVFFTAPPRLVGASTTNNSVYAWSVTYYFTLNHLDNAGEPLQRVTIAQDEGTDTVRFSSREIEAFEGSRDRLGSKLAVR